MNFSLVHEFFPSEFWSNPKQIDGQKVTPRAHGALAQVGSKINTNSYMVTDF